MNRRRRTRVPFETRIRFFIAGQEVLSSQTKDLSLNGVYLFSAARPALGTLGEVEISLALGPDPLRLALPGEVIRQDEKGMALQFREVTPEVFTHLKKVVDYNSGNPEAIEAELIRFSFDPARKLRED
ncbi:MAG: PilZ domain-containing protein [Deltaproteobacteria bacterium]|nr:PilZ domain-containing protein [Deltaproteobacteria bacterium]